MLKKLLILSLISVILTSCQVLKPKKVDTREIPISGPERARKNIEQGKGISVGNILGRGGTNFEFSSSNPMWRASLEILDFLPMTTVDYSGGIIITDWYSGESSKENESIKIAVRFLSNEIRADSLKIIVHKKNCSIDKNCGMKLLKKSKISDELRVAILKKAALLKKESKSKKKN